MEYIVSAGAAWETIDMNIRSHGTKMSPVEGDKVREGYNLFEGIEEVSAQVKSFRDGVLVFEFSGEVVTLQPGHIWHTPMRGKNNPHIQESVSYLVSVLGKPDPSKEEKYVNEAVSILDKMRKNAAEEWHPVWKNIPLAKEYLDILLNRLPLRGNHIDASGITVLCDAIFLEDLLDQRDTPRLCLEFLQLRKLAQQARTANDEKFDQQHYLGVIEADKLQNRLDLFISPTVSMDWWVDYVHAHLRFDPVERTPEWEEVVYEVEKECDRRLKHEPRGMGFCFSYWSTKQAVLKKYGIDWQTPSQMNPRVMFD